jgi:hypothetical protein
MSKLKINRNFFVLICSFVIIDLLSYLALTSFSLNQLVFALLVLICLGLSLYRLEYGLLMVLAELLIGSMGHMFVLPLGNYQLPIRMALWAIVMVIFAINFLWQLIKDKSQSQYLKKLKNFSPLKYFALLALFVVIGLVNAFLRKHALGLIFNDFNAWIYWLLLLPAIIVYSRDNAEEKKSIVIFNNLKTIFLSGAIFLSLKTLFLIYVFTHNISFSSEVYFWLRKTLVGEMTPTLSGWPRVFIQGQIFSGVALFLVFWKSLKAKRKDYLKNIGDLSLAALFASSILISFSRSFWVGMAGAVAFSFIVIWRYYSFRKAIFSMFWLLASMVISFIMIYFVSIVPYPTKGEFNANFIERVSDNNSEPAIASRWSLLPILGKEIKKEPFFGQGYGATVTYVSEDPRVLQNNPTGEYTTYAFEWGYLDLWLKIGLFGLLAYLLLIFYLVKEAVITGYKNKDLIVFGLSAGIIFLALTNFFTPYLNHPLGMGVLIIGACLIQKDRVY